MTVPGHLGRNAITLGPNAPCDPKSAIPGIVVGAFIDDKKSGRYLGAQNFAGMSLEDAVKKAKAEFDSPY